MQRGANTMRRHAAPCAPDADAKHVPCASNPAQATLLVPFFMLAFFGNSPANACIRWKKNRVRRGRRPRPQRGRPQGRSVRSTARSVRRAPTDSCRQGSRRAAPPTRRPPPPNTPLPQDTVAEVVQSVVDKVLPASEDEPPAAARSELQEAWDLSLATLARRDVRAGLSAAAALAVVAVALSRRGEGEDHEDAGWEGASLAVALAAAVMALGTMSCILPIVFDARYGDGPASGALQVKQRVRRGPGANRTCMQAPCVPMQAPCAPMQAPAAPGACLKRSFLPPIPRRARPHHA